MKNLLPVIAFFLSCAVSFGQDAAESLMKVFSGKRLDIDFAVNVRNSSKFGNCNGRLVYQDGAFIVTMDGFDAYSDKTDMWTVNHVSREAIVERSSSYDFLLHPEQLMELLGINPKKASLSMHYDVSGIPSGVDLKLKDGTLMELVFTKVMQMDEGPASDFSFDGSSLDSTYVVTDLR